jgi:hypothetical protein
LVQNLHQLPDDGWHQLLPLKAHQAIRPRFDCRAIRHTRNLSEQPDHRRQLLIVAGYPALDLKSATGNVL